MIRFGLGLSICLLAAGCSGAISTQTESQAYPSAMPSSSPTVAPSALPADYFPVSAGIKWVYSDRINGAEAGSRSWTVSSVKRNVDMTDFVISEVVAYSGFPEARLEIKFSKNPAEVVRFFGADNEPSRIIKLPALSGSTWNSGDAQFESSFEDVSVPAGIFRDCYCVTRHYPKTTQKDWYGPGIGLVKSESVDMSKGTAFSVSQELTSYSLATP